MLGNYAKIFSRPWARRHPKMLPKSTSARPPKYKPFTLKPAFLFTFFLITILFIVMTEVLYQKSKKNQGLFFADTHDDFTILQVFCSQYLLTIISVIYGMVWASVDLDVKRLEPYYQLSRPEGATAENSLLLHYPFDFLATVPIKAFRRKHWAVFCSGLALVLIFWVITPLQSALLATEVVVRDIPMDFVHSAELLPFEPQAKAARMQFYYNGYGVSWLDQKLPPFTTTKYAATPFRPASGGQIKGNITAVTKAYMTNLDCAPGRTEWVPGGTDYTSWNATDSSGTCSYESGSSNRKLKRLIEHDYVGDKEGCLNSGLSTAIILVEQNGPLIANFSTSSETVIFCNIRYSYIDVRITLDSEMSVISTEPVGSPVLFKHDDSIIDINSFEKLLLRSRHSFLFSNYLGTIAPEATSRLQDWGVNSGQPTVAYAIAMSPGKSFNDFKNPEVLGEAFEKAHQLLFSMFVASFFRDIPQENINQLEATPVFGIQSLAFVAVNVVYLVTRLLQGFLATVAVCFAFLGAYSFHRQANLFSDPDSLAAKMALVTYSDALLQDFDAEEVSKPTRNMEDQIYRLDNWGSSGSYRIDREKKITRDDECNLGSNIQGGRPSTAKPARPFVLRVYVGILFGLFLTLLLGFLIFLYKFAEENDGLPITSQGPFVTQIIFSFIPTIFATGIEPFWVLITRYFCVYQPYTELFKGQALPAASLGLVYTNIPPALVVFRALQSKHLVLALLSSTALLANVLAVSVGGLFWNGFRQHMIPSTFTQPRTTLTHAWPPNGYVLAFWGTYRADGFPLDLQGQGEHFIVANSNITRGAPLPPWTTKEYYFLPFESCNIDLTNKVFDKAITRGFGGTVDCKPFQDSNELLYPVFENITLFDDSGREIICTVDDNIFGLWDRTRLISLERQSISGEYEFQMRSVDTDADWSEYSSTFCRNVLVIGWARSVAKFSSNGENKSPDVNAYAHPGTTIGGIDGSYKSVTLFCQQHLKTALFEVTIDSMKKVQEYQAVGPVEDITNFLQNTTVVEVTKAITVLLTDSVSGVVNFHNDTSPSTFQHFLTEKLLNTSLSDPSQPLASFDTFNRGYSELYQRLVAIVFSLNAKRFFPEEAPNKIINGTTILQVKRVGMSIPMFYISAIVLSLNIIVLVIAFVSRPRNELPQFPDCLASEIALFYNCQALADVGGTSNMKSKARKRHLEALGHRYGYGKFVGKDGKINEGIERSSLLL